MAANISGCCVRAPNFRGGASKDTASCIVQQLKAVVTLVGGEEDLDGAHRRLEEVSNGECSACEEEFTKILDEELQERGVKASLTGMEVSEVVPKVPAPIPEDPIELEESDRWWLKWMLVPLWICCCFVSFQFCHGFQQKNAELARKKKTLQSVVPSDEPEHEGSNVPDAVVPSDGAELDGTKTPQAAVPSDATEQGGP